MSPPRGPPLQVVPTLARSHTPFPWEDEETLRTLNCRPCNVYLHDRDSMLAHLKGRPHLSQLQRLQDRDVRSITGGRGLSEVLRPDKNRMQYEDNFWDTTRAPVALQPAQKRFLDEKRLDKIKAKFDSKSYDYGQFKYDEEDLYCEVCDVWTRSRDVMQAHKEGQNHVKRSAKVRRFRCEICLVEVPCQDTLDNHMMGKDHIKREKQLQEKRKKLGEVVEGDNVGFKTGPQEMAKLSNTEREELADLRKSVKYLRDKVKSLTVDKARCRSEHGTQEVKDLLEYKQWCQETHIRPREFERPGIHCKKEEKVDDLQPSTSSRVNLKQEHTYRQQPPVKREYAEIRNFTDNRESSTVKRETYEGEEEGEYVERS